MDKPEAAQEKATMNPFWNAELAKIKRIRQEKAAMSDMPEKLYCYDSEEKTRHLAYLEGQRGDTEYTRTDLTYPKAKVDALIEVTKEISGRLKYLDTSDNGHVDSYSVELMDKARQAIAQLQANGTGGGDE